MPWKTTCTVDERRNFVAMAKAMPMAEACRRFGVSRKVGYKWLERYHRWVSCSSAKAW